MALGAISAGISVVGGLFGGGGARAPRMNNEQKQLLQSQANLNNALAQRISGGANGCQQAQKSCCGKPCQQGQQFGPLANCGMNGAGNGFGAGPMQNIMSGFGQLMDRMMGGGGFGGGGGFPGFGGGFGNPFGGFGGGCPFGGAGNQMGVNLNFNF